ncbi:lipoprotein LpqH [Skermania piniformis]|uniref:Lipoprotein LpqH n=1 Tax=Skermania pinensis TaxID=39122 RepID=A0ABX8S7G1_9ACTN|nr:lipoprotein LpqH [Skermania piniformis]QXQ13762.1 lipoprotein LpqH [Skermania piniformis]
MADLRVAAAAASLLAVTVALAGCGSSDEKSGTESSTAAVSGSDASGSVAPTSAGAATGVRSSVTLDGKPVEGSFSTTCAKKDGTLTLTLNDPEHATYGDLTVTAVLTAADDAVQSFSVAGTTGGTGPGPYTLGYTVGMPIGSAQGQNDGIKYKVTGQAVATDRSAPAASIPFDVIFSCDSVAGA